ncbi:MAG: hypothetical protein FJX62_08300 [Alphaproteobacteria bacterium]|nr:hypothetical protein [Alphaproteobacteria bacterium]
MLDIARMRNIPALVYIAPRPTDFFPFDPTAYAAFKQDLAALAAEREAGFANIEDAVFPDDKFGMADLAFGFYARDPFHFSADGHAQMADALLPHIRRHIVERRDRR